MKFKKGLVSIVLNCYNGEKYLKEALSSVKAQTYKNWELIFWDNRSKDKSAKIVKSFKIKNLNIIYQKTYLTLCSKKFSN